MIIESILIGKGVAALAHALAAHGAHAAAAQGAHAAAAQGAHAAAAQGAHAAGLHGSHGAIAQSARALAGNWAPASQHPIQWALQQGAHHGLHTAAAMMLDPSVSPATKIALSEVAYSQLHMLHAAGLPLATSPVHWHTILKLAELGLIPPEVKMLQKLKDAKLLPQSFETRDLKDLDEAGSLTDLLLNRVRETILGDTQPGFFLG